MMNSKKKMKMIVPHDGAQRKVRIFIPEDLIFEIIMRLPARSVGKFRSVSKLLLSTTTTTSFITAHLQRNRFTRQSLVIKFKEFKNLKRTIFYLPSVDTNIGSGITLREQPHMKLLNQSFSFFSCDGLTLSYNVSIKRNFVINPLTCQSFLLPEFKGLCGNWVFYFHHSTSTYCIFASSNDYTSDKILVVGKTHWRCIHDHRPAFVRGTYSLEVNQSLHWLAWKDYKDRYSNKPPYIIMTFDLEAEVYGLLPLPPSKDLDGRGGYLMNFNGELGLWVIDDYGIIDLWIMKECWIKRYSIKHPDLEGIPRLIKLTNSKSWQLGFAVSIKDEELLIGIKELGRPQYLVHWNLMSGVCFVKMFDGIGSFQKIVFPYMETLVFLDH